MKKFSPGDLRSGVAKRFKFLSKKAPAGASASVTSPDAAPPAAKKPLKWWALGTLALLCLAVLATGALVLEKYRPGSFDWLSSLHIRPKIEARIGNDKLTKPQADKLYDLVKIRKERNSYGDAVSAWKSYTTLSKASNTLKLDLSEADIQFGKENTPDYPLKTESKADIVMRSDALQATVRRKALDAEAGKYFGQVFMFPFIQKNAQDPNIYEINTTKRDYAKAKAEAALADIKKGKKPSLILEDALKDRNLMWPDNINTSVDLWYTSDQESMAQLLVPYQDIIDGIHNLKQPEIGTIQIIKLPATFKSTDKIEQAYYFWNIQSIIQQPRPGIFNQINDTVSKLNKQQAPLVNPEVVAQINPRFQSELATLTNNDSFKLPLTEKADALIGPPLGDGGYTTHFAWVRTNLPAGTRVTLNIHATTPNPCDSNVVGFGSSGPCENLARWGGTGPGSSFSTAGAGSQLEVASGGYVVIRIAALTLNDIAYLYVDCNSGSTLISLTYNATGQTSVQKYVANGREVYLPIPQPPPQQPTTGNLGITKVFNTGALVPNGFAYSCYGPYCTWAPTAYFPGINTPYSDGFDPGTPPGYIVSYLCDVRNEPFTGVYIIPLGGPGSCDIYTNLTTDLTVWYTPIGHIGVTMWVNGALAPPGFTTGCYGASNCWTSPGSYQAIVAQAFPGITTNPPASYAVTSYWCQIRDESTGALDAPNVPGPSPSCDVHPNRVTDINIYYVQWAIMEGVVFNDLNQNGIPEAGENYIQAGVNCGAYITVASTPVSLTNAYAVQPSNCGPHPYYVIATYGYGSQTVWNTPPAGWISTGVYPAGNAAGWSVTTNSATGNISPGVVYDVWFGVYQPPTNATIQGRSWNDANGNGIPDAGETLIQWPANACGGAYTNLGVQVQFDGAFAANYTYCSPDPYYYFFTGSSGSHTVSSTAPPAGWAYTKAYGAGNATGWAVTASSATGNISLGVVYDIWFGYRQTPDNPTGGFTAGTPNCSLVSVSLSYPTLPGTPVLYHVDFINGATTVASPQYSAPTTTSFNPFAVVPGLLPHLTYTVQLIANNSNNTTNMVVATATLNPCVTLSCKTSGVSYQLNSPQIVDYGFNIVNNTSLTYGNFTVAVFTTGAATQTGPVPATSLPVSLAAGASTSVDINVTITPTGSGFDVILRLKYNGGNLRLANFTMPAFNTCPNNSVPQSGGPEVCAVGDCGDINNVPTNKPYVKVYGGDVRSRGWITNAANQCVAAPDIPGVPHGSIAANAAPLAPPPGNQGSSVQYAAYALDNINNLYTASLRLSDPMEAAGLSFANAPIVAGTNGGAFGVPGDCLPDYYTALNPPAASVPSAMLTLNSGAGTGQTTIDEKNCPGASNLMGPPPTNLSAFPSSCVRLGSNGATSTQTSGGRYTFYINGNLVIRDNVIYPSVAFASKDIPLLTIVVRGNIYIDKAVTTLSGIYIAQTRAGSTEGGNIYTCTNDGAVTVIQYSDCNSQLTVYGEFVATNVKFQRTFGTLALGLDHEPYNAVAPVGPGEKFIFGPEDWIFPSYSGPPVISTGTLYDSSSNLPPLL